MADIVIVLLFVLISSLINSYYKFMVLLMINILYVSKYIMIMPKYILVILGIVAVWDIFEWVSKSSIYERYNREYCKLVNCKETYIAINYGLENLIPMNIMIELLIFISVKEIPEVLVLIKGLCAMVLLASFLVGMRNIYIVNIVVNVVAIAVKIVDGDKIGIYLYIAPLVYSIYSCFKYWKIYKTVSTWRG